MKRFNKSACKTLLKKNEGKSWEQEQQVENFAKLKNENITETNREENKGICRKINQHKISDYNEKENAY